MNLSILIKYKWNDYSKKNNYTTYEKKVVPFSKQRV